ncbi:hypothetical protein NZ35_25435 [Pseudomonas chlororaphis]|uniref:Uncharacterized protein n=1 Tax=Pseudomonas chlororaphis TaxID=587753 RepID=A0A0A6FCK7_9PSED|nr:hypothetical protein NZ35_25435 [Pseudomonas chlororaphis]
MVIYKGASGNASVLASPIAIYDYDAPEVEGVDVNDPEGNVPEELRVKGLNVIVERWPNFPDVPPRVDRLKVAWEFAGVTNWVYDELIYPVPPEKMFIKIDPSWLTKSGIAYVHYEVCFEDLNEDKSFKRKLTIDASPVNIAAPKFKGANPWGWMGCASKPPLWDGVFVLIAPDPGFDLGDVLLVRWHGYYSPNGSGTPIAKTYKEIRKKIETQEELANGVEVRIWPFDPHIEPMVNKASALARCFLERNGEVIRKSQVGLLRIDRVVSGQEEPCGPPKASVNKNDET